LARRWRTALSAVCAWLLLVSLCGQADVDVAATVPPNLTDYGRLSLDLSAYPQGSKIISSYALHGSASLVAYEVVGNAEHIFPAHHYQGGIVQTVRLPTAVPRFVDIEVDVFAHAADAQLCYTWVSNKTGWLSDQRDQVAALGDIRPWSSGYSLIFSGAPGSGVQEYAWMRQSNILITIRVSSSAMTRRELPPMTRDMMRLGHLLAGHIAHLQALGLYRPAA
jgi:hypothetical protein